MEDKKDSIFYIPKLDVEVMPSDLLGQLIKGKVEEGFTRIKIMGGMDLKEIMGSIENSTTLKQH